MRPLPGGDPRQHRLDRLSVADQVVVDNEGDLHPRGAQRFQLDDHLVGVFSLGRRPKVTMMSQNSHWNGQPRKICKLPNR